MTVERNGREARVRRLRDLAQGLAREAALLERRGDPLDTWERRGYLRNLYDAVAGLEAARVVLEAVLKRTDREAGRVA